MLRHRAKLLLSLSQLLAQQFLIFPQVSQVLLRCHDTGLHLFIETVSCEFKRLLLTLVEIAVVWVLAHVNHLLHQLDLGLYH